MLSEDTYEKHVLHIRKLFEVSITSITYAYVVFKLQF